MDLQLVFMYCITRNYKHVVLQIVDLGTAYSGSAIVGIRNMITITVNIDS